MPKEPDLFDRDSPDDLRYKVPAIVKRHFNKRSKSIQCLVRWQGYDAEDGKWLKDDELEHCQELPVKDYEQMSELRKHHNDVALPVFRLSGFSQRVPCEAESHTHRFATSNQSVQNIPQ